MNLDNVFKANDIRGIYGKDINEDLAYKVARAVVRFLKCTEIFVGRDMRLSSIKLFKYLARGVVESGCNVIDLGLIDTPALYFASGYYKKSGMMITASHNPAEYNGIKIVREEAKPVDMQSGLDKIKKIIQREDFFKVNKNGKIFYKDIFKEYKKFVLSFIDLGKIAGIKIVVDAGNGMAASVVPKIYRNLDINYLPLYFKLDGRFPHHVPNPIVKKNIADLIKKVKKEKVDFGVAFDGDMDRVAFVDERGKFVNPSFIGALLVKYLLQSYNRKEKQTIVFTSAASRIVRDIVSKYLGRPLRGKVGHAFIKSRMREENALFGMEHSAHYYYRDNCYADSGLITSLLVFEIYSQAKKLGMKFSDLIKEFDVYSQADEVSLSLHDGKDVLEKIEKYYRAKKPEKIDHFDGLTVDFDNYWFSVRKSNTEPLLRINLEAIDRRIMKEKLREILNLVKHEY